MMHLPYLANPCMEVILYFHQYFITNDANLVPAKIKFNRTRSMQSLGLIDSVVSSKHTFLTEQSYVAAYKIGNHIYYNDQ